MERQQERWLLEWLLVVSRVAVGALFVMTVGAAVVERLLERLLVVAIINLLLSSNMLGLRLVPLIGTFV